MLLFWIVLTLTIILLLGTIVFIIWYVKERDSYIAASAGAILFCSLVFGAIALVLGIDYNNKQKSYSKFLYNIVSLERDSAFVIGRGYADSTQYYYCYQEVNKNAYKLQKFNCDHTYIVETNETPSVYEVKDKGESIPHYNIYVPFGTIISQYNA